MSYEIFQTVLSYVTIVAFWYGVVRKAIIRVRRNGKRMKVKRQTAEDIVRKEVLAQIQLENGGKFIPLDIRQRFGLIELFDK